MTFMNTSLSENQIINIKFTSQNIENHTLQSVETLRYLSLPCYGNVQLNVRDEIDDMFMKLFPCTIFFWFQLK